MRNLVIAAATAALAGTMPVAADANPGGGWNGPRPGGMNMPHPGGMNMPRPGGMHGPRPGGWNGGPIGGNGCLGGCVHRPRWGGRISNRWWGGMRAPGGWNAYRRPTRGYVLPSYWISPSWYVSDWSNYGLSAPPAGYTWSRYYDDAVLVDGRGSVYDSVGGVGWDRYDGPDADYSYDDSYDDRGYDERGYDERAGGYGPAPRLAYPGPTRDANNGLGGAIIGGVAGGVAGNVIAGRGNRLGGTLIGAGAGALIGQAIDKSDRRGRVPVAPRDGYDGYAEGYGAPYPVPGRGYAPPVAHGGRGAPTVAYQEGTYGGDYAGTTYSGVTYYGSDDHARHAPRGPYPAPGYPGGGYPMGGYAPGTIVTGNGSVVTTSSAVGGGGYVAGGWYFPPATITTVTVSGASSSGAVEEEYYETERSAPAKGYRYKGGCRC